VKLGPEIPDVSQDFALTCLGETPRRSGQNRLRLGALAGVLLGALNGCGYHPVYGSATGARYEVVAGRYGTSSFEAAQDTVMGVRSELGAAQALGSGFPRVVVEVLRVDERSTGVHSMGNAGPLARGSEIIVVGRAQVLEKPDGAPSIDTGDVSRSAAFASGTTPSADAAARSRAVRDAARSLGKALGRAVLGLPEPTEG
jgi:hypothetical protein